MFCTHCGASNDDNAWRCTSCGRELRATIPPRPPQLPPGSVPNHLVPAILTTVFYALFDLILHIPMPSGIWPTIWRAIAG